MKRILFITTILFNTFSLFSQTEFIYGLNNQGGEFDGGNLYRMKPDGTEHQVLYQFDFNNITRPNGKLIQDQNGFIYGTSPNGGRYGRGTLFQFNPTNKEIRVIYHFNRDSIGSEPRNVLFLTPLNKIIGQCESNLEIFEFDLNNSSMSTIPEIQNSLNSRIIHSIFELNGRIFLSSTDFNGLCDVIEFNEVNRSTSLMTSISTTVYNKPIEINDSIYLGTCHISGESGNIKRSFFYRFNLNSNTLTFSGILNPSIHGYSINENIHFIGPNRIIASCAEGGAKQTGTLIEYNLISRSTDTLYNFNYTDGANPRNIILVDSNTIIGTCFAGGNNIDGTIFKYDIVNNQTTRLKDISDLPYGKHPNMNLLKTDSNTIVFNTVYGGKYRDGTLLKYQINKDSLHLELDYNASKNGAFPVSNLIQFDNKLLGTAARNAGFFTYNLNTGDYVPYNLNGSGLTRLIKIDSVSFLGYNKAIIGPSFIYQFNKDLNPIHSGTMFDGNSSIDPIGDWIVHSNGKLYGCGNGDGRNNQGTLFQYDPSNNNLNIRYHFTDSNLIGINPIGGLMELQNGSLVGLANNATETSVFNFNLNTNQIVKIGSIPARFLVNQRFGFVGYKDSLLFGLASDNGMTKLYRYNIVTDQFRFIGAGAMVGNNSIFSKPIIGTDSNLYYSLYTGGNNFEGLVFKYAIEKDSLYQLLNLNDSMANLGIKPLEILFLEPFTISVNEINRNNKTQKFQLFPNPVAEQLTIESEKSINSIRIFNINGQLVFEKKAIEEPIFKTTLNQVKGTYILEIVIDNRAYRKKYIKQ